MFVADSSTIEQNNIHTEAGIKGFPCTVTDVFGFFSTENKRYFHIDCGHRALFSQSKYIDCITVGNGHLV